MKGLSGCLIIIVCVALTTGCQSVGQAQPGGKREVVQHIVVLWLKDRGSIGDRERLMRSAKELAKLPGVIDVRAGIMLPSDRPIVDSTYDVAMIFSFESRKAMVDYIVNPVHKKAVDEIIKPLVERIVVYDFIEQ